MSDNPFFAGAKVALRGYSAGEFRRAIVEYVANGVFRYRLDLESVRVR